MAKLHLERSHGHPSLRRWATCRYSPCLPGYRGLGGLGMAAWPKPIAALLFFDGTSWALVEPPTLDFDDEDWRPGLNDLSSERDRTTVRLGLGSQAFRVMATGHLVVSTRNLQGRRFRRATADWGALFRCLGQLAHRLGRCQPALLSCEGEKRRSE